MTTDAQSAEVLAPWE